MHHSPHVQPFTGFTGRIRKELVLQFPVDELSPEFKRSRENKRPPTLRYGWVVYNQTGIWDYTMSRMKQHGIRPTRKLPENFVPEHGDHIWEFLDVLNILRDESGVFEATTESVTVEAQFLLGGYRVNYFISAYTNYARERDLPSQEEVEKLGSLLGLPGKPQCISIEVRSHPTTVLAIEVETNQTNSHGTRYAGECYSQSEFVPEENDDFLGAVLQTREHIFGACLRCGAHRHILWKVSREVSLEVTLGTERACVDALEIVAKTYISDPSAHSLVPQPTVGAAVTVTWLDARHRGFSPFFTL
ncbi:hypothetical protein FISHEDRAFT_56899, partial [Fistulina hepatica ATCC 64428]